MSSSLCPTTDQNVGVASAIERRIAAIVPSSIDAAAWAGSASASCAAIRFMAG